MIGITLLMLLDDVFAHCLNFRPSRLTASPVVAKISGFF